MLRWALLAAGGSERGGAVEGGEAGNETGEGEAKRKREK